jgi:hypothetical protein
MAVKLWHHVPGHGNCGIMFKAREGGGDPHARQNHLNVRWIGGRLVIQGNPDSMEGDTLDTFLALYVRWIEGRLVIQGNPDFMEGDTLDKLTECMSLPFMMGGLRWGKGRVVIQSNSDSLEGDALNKLSERMSLPV